MMVATEMPREGSDGGRGPIVLVAIEPRSYGDAIGRVVEFLRPGLAVRVVEPSDLDAEVACLGSDLVVCSRPRTSCSGSGPRWVEFYPYNERTPIRVDGRPEKLAAVELEDLLAVIDRLVLEI